MNNIIKRLLPKRDPVERIIYIFVFLIFSAFAAFYLYIYLWGFMTGFKSHNDIILNPFGIPEKWHFGNYIEIFSYLNVKGNTYFQMLFNSCWFSIIGPLIAAYTTAMFAYACTKYRFPGSTLVYPIILVVLTMPIYGSGGSVYLIQKKMGLINSYARVLLSFSGVSIWFLYFSATFSGVSETYREAAVLDGANDFQVFFLVMLPQARNMLLAMFLMLWQDNWNDYSSVLLYLPEIPTLAAGVYLCEIDMLYDVRYDMIYAAYMVAAIPPLIIFACFSDILTKSVSVGGIKE